MTHTYEIIELRSTRMNPKNVVTEVPGDPVLPNQGGRMMKSDPDQLFPPTEDELRFRAYLIFEARGCNDGRALDYWPAAEAELSTEQEEHLDTHIIAA